MAAKLLVQTSVASVTLARSPKNTAEQKNAPKLRKWSLANGSPIPRNSVIFSVRIDKTMEAVEASIDFAKVLAEMDAIGCVLEFSFYQSDTDASSLESHFRAARQFLRDCETSDREFAKNFDYDDFPPHARVKPFVWQESLLHGNLITFADFIGNTQIHPTQLSATAWTMPNVNGLMTAFFHPPHGINGSIESNMPIYLRLLDALAGNEKIEDLIIYSWDTNCSNYFDDGHEWWGAFFWTISQPSDRIVTVIVASTTD